jgi:peptidoglycan/xylan/chitin deacetylase (PgdA/CDA1 family)
MTTCYSSLRGHESEFLSGSPILMYHKLGSAPRGTKLRGLYVSAALFTEQLQEWRAAGGAWNLLDHTPQQPGMVVTFDDGFLNTLTLGLEPLREAGCCAMQFLVPGLIGKINQWDLVIGEVPEALMNVAQIKEWLAAGHQIGAHTMTHPRLTQIPLAQAREEIAASKKMLEDLFGQPICHFAYPYGDWNAAVRDLVIEAGFETACTTETGINVVGQDRWTLGRYLARRPSRKLFRPSTWFV